MHYCLANVFSEPYKNYHWDIVCLIAEHFPKLIETKEQQIPTHFTLKYEFETDDMSKVEVVLEKFAKKHSPKPISIGGFDKFGELTVFVKVQLSEAAKIVFDELIDTLHVFDWMQWQKYDGKDLHFHSTVAEECTGLDKEVLDLIRGKERHFKSRFDNISIFVENGKTEHGYRKWKLYKKIDFKLG